MKKFLNAREILEKNQVAICVFTHGDYLSFDSLGNGVTGKWVADLDMVEEVDKVIIYLRRDNELLNRIYLGNYAGQYPSDLPRRLMIRFSRLKEVGTTDSNWLEFAGSGQNPVSYVSG